MMEPYWHDEGWEEDYGGNSRTAEESMSENPGVFDTYDRIIDETELDNEEFDLEGDSGMSSEHWGMTFALADELADEKSSKYSLDENTDTENLKQAMRQNPPNTNGDKELRPFEQIINDICKGQRSLFDTNY